MNNNARWRARNEAIARFAYDSIELDKRVAKEASELTRAALIEVARQWGVDNHVSVRTLLAKMKHAPIKEESR